MINVLNRHHTLTNFYHSKNHLVFPKNEYNYISKAKQEYNNLLYDIERKRKNNNNKIRLIYHSTERNSNNQNIKSFNSRKRIIPQTTSFNFWKGRESFSKFNYEKFLEKSDKNTVVKRNNFLYNSFNMNAFKSEKEPSNKEQKSKVNSKLFELFINDYEKKIKKALDEIGNNEPIKPKNIQPESEKTTNNNNYEIYLKNFNNLPFLNNDEEEKENKENINKNNINNNNNNFENFNNEIEENNSIYRNNTKKIINKAESFRVKSPYTKKNVKVYSSQKNKNKENKINKDELDKKLKIRLFSSSPYTIKATMHRNLNTYFDTVKDENKISNYEIGKIIGKGAYAVVKLCKNKVTQEKFAMKIYEKKKLKDHVIKYCISKEIEILKKLNHPNIVKLYDVIYTDKYILLIQELVNGISLRNFYDSEIRNQENISDRKLQILNSILNQILSAFDHIHKKGIAHRDIKLENILMTKNNEIKIIDFGFGMINQRNNLQKFFCGTPNYMAPEIVLKKDYNGQKVDIWSLGVLIYKLFCADFPFKGKNQKELYNQIIKGKFTIKDYVPGYIKKIIEKMIRVKPNQRISCEQALVSFWLKN